MSAPDALAKLRRGKSQHDWVVPVCPHCGREHRHGGGDLHENPHDFLGHRVAHCLTGGRDGYNLVHDAQAV